MTWDSMLPLVVTALLTLLVSLVSQFFVTWLADRRARKDRLLETKREAFVRIGTELGRAVRERSIVADGRSMVFEAGLYDLSVGDAVMTVIERLHDGLAAEVGDESTLVTDQDPTGMAQLQARMAASLGTHVRDTRALHRWSAGSPQSPLKVRRTAQTRQRQPTPPTH